MAYFLYILCCRDNSLYCGITNNLAKRLDMHRQGKGSKYVRAKLPIRLIYIENFPDKVSAAKREYEVKNLSRGDKIKQLSLDLENEVSIDN